MRYSWLCDNYRGYAALIFHLSLHHSRPNKWKIDEVYHRSEIVCQ